MDFLFLEARPISSHALMALLAEVIGGGTADEREGNISAKSPGLYLGQAHDVRVDLLVFRLRDCVVGRLQPNPPPERLDHGDLVCGCLLCAR